MRVRRLFLLTAALGATAALVVSSTTASTNRTTAAARDTLVMAVQEIGTTIDPKIYQASSVTILQATQEPLLFYSLHVPKGSTVPVFDPSKMTPGVVASWKLDPNYKFMTMNLRKGVKSAYGNELTTADIQWTVTRNCVLKTLGCAFLFGQAGIDPTKPITILGKYRFQWNLKNPSPNIERGLNFHWQGPFDSTEAKKHASDKDPWAEDWLSTHTAAFGPYNVTQFTAGQSATLEANPNYYLGAVPIKRIVMRVVPDPGNRQQLLTSGAVQYAPDIPRVQLAQLAKNKGVKVEYGRSTRMLYLLMNVKAKPWDNRLVRQAVAYAIPYAQINSRAYNGTASVASGPVSPLFTLYHDPKTWTYKTDIAKAKQLLTQAGFPNGFSAKLQYSLSNPGPENAQVAVLVQSALRQIGINVELAQATSDAAYFADLLAKKVPFGLGGTAPFLADAGYQLFNTGAGPSGFAAYDDPQYLAQVNAANRLVDPKSRTRALRRAQVYWNRDVPMVPIVEPNYGVAMDPKLTGFNIQSTGFPRLGLFKFTG